MKIKSVKILGDNFRSLTADRLYEFNVNERTDRLSTKVFAGLNGSGKSNFLELFSEIFYYLEIFHLSTTPEEEKRNAAFGFEIEYYLPESLFYFHKGLDLEYETLRKQFYSRKVKWSSEDAMEDAIELAFRTDCKAFIKDGDIRVRIIKPLGIEPQFAIRNYQTNLYRVIQIGTESLLPPRIIAYTSGQNELLSNPYHKLKYHYFKLFEDKQRPELGKALADNHRLFYLDYGANFSIFIANMLLGEGYKAGVMKEVLQIEDLCSFRITLNTNKLYDAVIPNDSNIAGHVIKLTRCATTWIEKKVGENNLMVLDYFVTPALREAFSHYFGNSFQLFKAFYELEIFNLFLVDRKTRDLILQAHKTYNISDEMPKPDPSRLTFRIEKVRISKVVESDKPPVRIYYKALSDGEHQFNEVLGTVLMMQEPGCLFLIDEPDTHFNPKWRAKLIKLLNIMAAEEFDEKNEVKKVRSQEIILTTHSPFVVSDSDRLDVYRFVKNKGVVEFSNPEMQVYGASISLILNEIFEKAETISEMAKGELKAMVENIETMDDLKKVVDRLNNDFGDSVEKFDLVGKLRSIKEAIEKRDK